MNRELYTVPPEFAHDVADGRDTWWADYKESSEMANNATMTLADARNRQMFEDALKSVQENRLSLKEYDANLLQNLEEGYRLAGIKMRITVKQFNYLRQLAWDFEKGA